MQDLTIKQFIIHNYRGLNNVCLDNLSNVNILVGANNSGKTSVLEALKIMSAPNEEGNIIHLATYRRGGMSGKQQYLVNYLLSIFQRVKEEDNQHYRIGIEADVNGKRCVCNVDGAIGEYIDLSDMREDSSQTFDLAIRTEIAGKKKYSISTIYGKNDYRYTIHEDPLFKCLYFHSHVNYYTSCVSFLTEHIVQEGKNDVLQMLKTFDKNIVDISIINDDIYLTNKFSGSLPLFSYGLGTQKAVLLILALMRAQNGVLLIDEIDNAIHISVFKDVFKWFITACVEKNVQAFITTHSAEALDEILKLSHKNNCEKNIRVITLRKNYENNETYCKVRTGEEAYEDRKVFRMELRV